MGGDLVAEKLSDVTFSANKECSWQGTPSMRVQNQNQRNTIHARYLSIPPK